MEEKAAERERYRVRGMKIVLGLVFFPLLPLAIAFNLWGMADYLSFLPGIGNGGGAVAGLAAVIYVGAVVGVAVGGGAVATGGDVPIVSNGDSSPETMATPTQPPTPTTVSTPSFDPSPTPTSTVAASAAELHDEELEAFETEYRHRVSQTMRNDSLTGIPVLATEYRTNNHGQLELWIVFWECDQFEPLEDQRLTIANEYVGSVGEGHGDQPDRLRMYGVSDLTNFEDTITYIPATSAEAAWNGSLSADTFIRNWWERQRIPTQSENETAYQMVVEDSGRDKADEAFYDDHREPTGCPGDAEAHDSNTNELGTNNAVTFAPLA